MARKKQTAAQQALEAARLKSQTGANWIDIHNTVFGIGGLSTKLFPTEAERVAFTRSDEYAEIMKLLDEAPDQNARRPEVSGKFLVRIPKSLHAALVVEAKAENTTLNQLVVAKLGTQLRAMVQ